MNWYVFFWEDDQSILVGKYNNYDLESGYMEHSITRYVKSRFPDAKLDRDNAGMVEKIDGQKRIHIMPQFVV